MCSLRFCPSELDDGGTRSGMTSDLTRPKQSVEKGNRAETHLFLFIRI